MTFADGDGGGDHEACSNCGIEEIEEGKSSKRCSWYTCDLDGRNFCKTDWRLGEEDTSQRSQVDLIKICLPCYSNISGLIGVAYCQ